MASSYRVKHQVFISSTFTDLEPERADVMQAVLELECIPAGMEAFVASNEEQWAIIKDVIAECDYYVLILAGRYGSLTPDGLSYTEKEYRLAKELDVPILAFVRKDIPDLPSKHVEHKSDSRAKLDALRAEVMSERMVKEWSTAGELGGLVSRALSQAMKRTPRPGWVRNDGGLALDHLTRINELMQENASIREELASRERRKAPPDNLEQGADKFRVSGFYMLRSSEGYSLEQVDWACEMSWNRLLKFIGPILVNEASEAEVKGRMSDLCIYSEDVKYADIKDRVMRRTIYDNKYDDIILQFRALGIIEAGKRKRAISDTNRYWKLTAYGDELLVNLMARRRKGGAQSPKQE